MPRLVFRLRVETWLTGRALLSSWRDRTCQQPWGTVSGVLKCITWQTGGSRDNLLNLPLCLESIWWMNNLLQVKIYGQNLAQIWSSCDKNCVLSSRVAVVHAYLHYPLQLLWEACIQHNERHREGVAEPQVHLVSSSLFHLEQAEQIPNRPSEERNKNISIEMTPEGKYRWYTLIYLSVFISTLKTLKWTISGATLFQIRYTFIVMITKFLHVTCVEHVVQGSCRLSCFP